MDISKKKFNTYTINLILIPVLLVWLTGSILYSFWFRNIVKTPELPEKFSSYKSLGAAPISKNYEISFLRHNKLSFNAPLFYPEYAVVIAYAAADQLHESTTDTYYKLNTSGKLIDSLILNDERYQTDLNNGYFLNKNYYYSWIVDGNPKKQAYIPINESLQWNKERLSQEFNALTAASSSIFYFRYNQVWDMADPRRDKEIDKVVFLKGKKWYALYGKNIYMAPTAAPLKTVLKDLMPVSKATQAATGSIQLAYFYKKTLNEAGPQGKNIWSGPGYLNLILQKDTLKFKTEVIAGEDGQEMTYSYNLKYYTHPGLNFGLLLNMWSDMYVVKPRNKD